MYLDDAQHSQLTITNARRNIFQYESNKHNGLLFGSIIYDTAKRF